MSTAAQKPATTPIPVQLSATEFTAFIFPHLSMPKRGPQCKLAYSQKTRNRFDSRVYDPAMAEASTCILFTLSCILDANGGRNSRSCTSMLRIIPQREKQVKSRLLNQPQRRPWHGRHPVFRRVAPTRFALDRRDRVWAVAVRPSGTRTGPPAARQANHEANATAEAVCRAHPQAALCRL